MKKTSIFVNTLLLMTVPFTLSSLITYNHPNKVYATTEAESDTSKIERIPSFELEKPLIDGEYILTTNPDRRGNTTYLKMLVQDGQVIEFEYDALLEDGSIKSEDEDYNLAMKSDGGTSYAEGKEEIENQILESQEPEVDTVSGATTSARVVNDMSKVIFAMAQNNITEDVNYNETFYEGIMFEFVDTDCAC